MKTLIFHILLIFASVSTLILRESEGFSLMKTMGRYPRFFKTRVKDANFSPLELFDLNQQRIYPKLSQLARTPFFRYYKVDIDTSCPFWTVQFHCMKSAQKLGGCSLDEPTNLPECQKKEEQCSTINNNNNLEADLANLVDEFGNTQNSETETPRIDENQKRIDQINRQIAENPKNWWPQPQDKMLLTDLLINPEGNTGYSGPEPKKVWDAILFENSFKTNSSSNLEMKLQELFNSLLKAQYISTTAKISAYYFLDDSGVDAKLSADKTRKQELFSPNLEMFKRALQNKPNFEELLGNLMKLWVTTAHAIKKLPISQMERFIRECETESKSLEMINSILSESKSFLLQNENILEPFHNAGNIANEIKFKLFNVSSVLDCVGCEKCKVWSKVQMHSLAVALKIIFSDDGKDVVLERNEISALFNGFIAHSLAIKNIFDFFEMQDRSIVSKWFSISTSGLIVVLLLFFLFEVFRKNYFAAGNNKKEKVKQE